MCVCVCVCAYTKSLFIAGAQVISRALEVWLLSMVPLTSPSKKDVLTNPVYVSEYERRERDREGGGISAN